MAVDHHAKAQIFPHCPLSALPLEVSARAWRCRPAYLSKRIRNLHSLFRPAGWPQQAIQQTPACGRWRLLVLMVVAPPYCLLYLVELELNPKGILYWGLGSGLSFGRGSGRYIYGGSKWRWILALEIWANGGNASEPTKIFPTWPWAQA